MNTHIKLYIFIALIIIGIIIVSAGLYLNTRQYQAVKQIKEQQITPTPTPEAPIEIKARADIKNLEIDSLAQPGNAKLLQEQAEAHFLLGEYDRAALKYQQAIEINNTDPALHLGLGNVFLQLNKLEEAIVAYEQSTTQENAGTQPYIQLANLYTRQQPNKTKVIESYTRGIQANPQDTSIRILFASFYEQIQEKELALQQYRNVLAIDPKNIIALQKVEQLSGN
ncbi:MAG: tetratricopeptide repeat protein [bacterium]|nr:tetratricopeptide repeat protein [bacterium]